MPAKKTQRLRRDFFGPPPLLKGEDSAAFYQFLAKTTAAVKPADFLEEIFVRDFVELDWEVVRLRRLKVDLIDLALRDKIRDALQRLTENNDDDETDDQHEIDVDALASGWAVGDPHATKQVEEILKSLGTTIQELLVKASIYEINEIERIDKLIMAVEARRNGLHREIERRRQAPGQKLRPEPEQIDDVDYKVVEQNGRVSKSTNKSRQRTSQ